MKFLVDVNAPILLQHSSVLLQLRVNYVSLKVAQVTSRAASSMMSTSRSVIFNAGTFLAQQFSIMSTFHSSDELKLNGTQLQYGPMWHLDTIVSTVSYLVIHHTAKSVLHEDNVAEAILCHNEKKKKCIEIYHGVS